MKIVFRLIVLLNVLRPYLVLNYTLKTLADRFGILYCLKISCYSVINNYISLLDYCYSLSSPIPQEIGN